MPRASTAKGRTVVVNGHSLALNSECVLLVLGRRAGELRRAFAAHVMVSVPWSRREGEPYLIARVMEVLPAMPATETGIRVRVAYYLRPRDISNRYIADHRLVVATMHTDVVPAEYVRGVCTVRHKESITDTDAYKRERDAFYWHQVSHPEPRLRGEMGRPVSGAGLAADSRAGHPLQLYDRYLHRYFDAVSTDKIQNAPGT